MLSSATEWEPTLEEPVQESRDVKKAMQQIGCVPDHGVCPRKHSIERRSLAWNATHWETAGLDARKSVAQSIPETGTSVTPPQCAAEVTV